MSLPKLVFSMPADCSPNTVEVEELQNVAIETCVTNVSCDVSSIEVSFTHPTQNKGTGTAATPEWEECLYQLGQALRTVREAKAISYYELHSLTRVPLYHIKSLESGNLSRLPEKIFVRGFIRRIGDALGLDGTQLVAYLPADESMQSLRGSWDRSQAYWGFSLSRVHLYLGYVILLISAVVGLFSLSDESTQALSPKQVNGNLVDIRK